MIDMIASSFINPRLPGQVRTMLAGAIKMVCAFALLAFMAIGGVAHGAPSEAHQVAQSMRDIWDKPEAPLVVDPVVIEGDYALAGWVQQDRGGRALLARVDGTWQVHVCGGDGLNDVGALEMAGMSAAAARRLVDALSTAEAKLPQQTREKFASFGQNIQVNGAHAPH